METTITDFELNTEESFFTHTPSGFMLDGDFVLLFPYDDVTRLFAIGSGNYNLSNETIDELRAQIMEYRDKQESDKIINSLPPEEIQG